MTINVQYTVFCDGTTTEPYRSFRDVLVVPAGSPCTRWEYVDGETRRAARTAARRAGWQELPDGTHRCPEHRTDR